MDCFGRLLRALLVFGPCLARPCPEKRLTIFESCRSPGFWAQRCISSPHRDLFPSLGLLTVLPTPPAGQSRTQLLALRDLVSRVCDDFGIDCVTWLEPQRPQSSSRPCTTLSAQHWQVRSSPPPAGCSASVATALSSATSLLYDGSHLPRVGPTCSAHQSHWKLALCL